MTQSEGVSNLFDHRHTPSTNISAEDLDPSCAVRQPAMRALAEGMRAIDLSNRLLVGNRSRLAVIKLKDCNID